MTNTELIFFILGCLAFGGLAIWAGPEFTLGGLATVSIIAVLVWGVHVVESFQQRRHHQRNNAIEAELAQRFFAECPPPSSATYDTVVYVREWRDAWRKRFQ